MYMRGCEFCCDRIVVCVVGSNNILPQVTYNQKWLNFCFGAISHVTKSACTFVQVQCNCRIAKKKLLLCNPTADIALEQRYGHFFGTEDLTSILHRRSPVPKTFVHMQCQS